MTTTEVRPVSKGKLLRLARDGKLVLVERSVIVQDEEIVEVSRVERLVHVLCEDGNERGHDPGALGLPESDFLRRSSWACETGDGLITLFVSARLSYVFRVQS
jgi:hypothetical protein